MAFSKSWFSHTCLVEDNLVLHNTKMYLAALVGIVSRRGLTTEMCRETNLVRLS